MGIYGLFTGWGICTLFESPPWGFCMNTRPHRGAFAAFPKQNDKCPGVGWAHLELTEPLCLNKTLFNP